MKYFNEEMLDLHEEESPFLTEFGRKMNVRYDIVDVIGLAGASISDDVV